MKGKYAQRADNRREHQHESTERRLRAELSTLRRECDRERRAHADRDSIAVELARLKEQVREGASDELVAVQSRLRNVCAAMDNALHTIAVFAGKAARTGDEGSLSTEEWGALGDALGPEHFREWMEAAGETFFRAGRRHLKRGHVGAHLRAIEDMDRQEDRHYSHYRRVARP